MATKITAPVKGYTGQTYIGPVVLDFDKGVATTDVELSKGVKAYLKDKGYKLAEAKDGSQSSDPDGEFNPSEHTVDEVLAHLASDGVDEAEIDRVKAAEAADKGRKGIADYEPESGAEPGDQS